MSEEETSINPFSQILFIKNGRHDINPITIYDFFSKNNKINVPKYQRPYSWNSNNVNDLLQDIKNIYVKETKGWFIGSIFTTYNDNVIDDKFNQVNILDGQQRLTTIQILINELFLLKYTDINYSENKKLINLNNALAECLTKRSEPRFGAEENVKDFWNKYILDSKNSKKESEIKELRETLENQSEHLNLQGVTTPIKILENSILIKNYLHKEFIESTEDIEIRQNNLISFIKATMDQLWLIETPLKNAQEVVHFFEGINNRGKELTITDKLKYKSFTSQPEEKWTLLTQYWKEIYSGLEYLETKKYIKGDDDFFKVFFNSLGKDDLTKDHEIIDLYEKEYLSNILEKNKSKNFFNQVGKIIDFFKSLDQTNHIDFEKLPENKTNITLALLRLFKSSLKISDNIRLLLFSGIRTNIDDKLFRENNIYIIQQLLWKLIRFVLFVEINSDLSSNGIRNYYLIIIGSCQSTSQYLKGNKLFELNINDDVDDDEIFGKNDSISHDDLKLVSSKLIKTKDNNIGSFIILLYCFLDDYNMLINSSQAVKKYHLDHLFPITWWTYWEEKVFTRNDAIITINNLNDNYFKNYSREDFRSDINKEELKFELEKNKKRDTNRLIEYIGNKWVLDKKLNVKSKNKIFSVKKKEYKDDIYAKFPNNGNSVGMDNYEEFSHNEIIERSLKIINVIHQKWKSDIESLM